MSKFTSKSFVTFTQACKRHTWAILGVAVLVWLTAAGHAQTTASISGTVHDITGAMVPDAKVVAINEASKAERTTTSNGLGFFSFNALQPATYTLRVSRKNFETWYVTGIVVHPGDDLAVPKIALKVGGTDVTVTVTAKVAGVTLNSPEHSTLITADDIDRLSTVGRDVDELLATQPGFTLNAGTDMQNEGPGGLYGFQVVGPGNGQLGSWGAGGAAPQQGLVNLKSDGANLIDPGDMGGQMSNVNMDQVQEVKISTSNFGADQSKGP
ncbi:MAG: carboxypeptidase regulatory-like domain-containing protein, partial [Terracidiphilus sp.]